MSADRPSSIPTVRASACPGLLRIVPALDGGICRVKLPCGHISVAQALAVADAAEGYANGVLEITNRANLQVRGVRESYSRDLVATLIAADLGPLLPGGDDVRNVLLNPTFGIDPAQIIDTGPLALRLLERLQMQSCFHRLSPKFSISIDGGEAAAMVEHPHDIWLSAFDASEPMFVFGVGGCPQRRESALGMVSATHALELIEATIYLFQAHADGGQTRTRHLLQTMSAPRFFQLLEQRVPFTLVSVPSDWQRTNKRTGMHIGVHSQRQNGLSYVGATPLLGRLDAGQLRAMAQLAQAFGDATLRMTPFQSILLPNIPEAAAARVVKEATAIGLTVESDDACAHVVACAGASGCAKSRADTKTDALRFIETIDDRRLFTDVHFSGCERSCAAAHIAPFTLLAVAAGRYDVYRRIDDDLETFGELMARYRTIEQCAALLKQQENSHA